MRLPLFTINRATQPAIPSSHNALTFNISDKTTIS